MNNGVAKNILMAIVGYALALMSQCLLIIAWYMWSQGSLGDCPNYAFGANWYPEPPIAVTFFPFILDAIAISIFVPRLSLSRRNGQRFHTVLNEVGLILSCLPIIAGFAVPLISELLRQSTHGC